MVGSGAVVGDDAVEWQLERVGHEQAAADQDDGDQPVGGSFLADPWEGATLPCTAMIMPNACPNGAVWTHNPPVLGFEPRPPHCLTVIVWRL
jgi:hypothetical protein